MDANTHFDYEGYFRDLTKKNRLTREHDFHFCTCSGIQSLEGPLQNFRTKKAFICVDDTNDGSLMRGRNGGWFKNRTMTVFILHRYTFDDMADRAAKLAICREVFRQFTSRMLIDEDDLANDMIYMRVENILSRELGQYFMSGCTGLYFMLEVAEPTNLVFNRDEWMT